MNNKFKLLIISCFVYSGSFSQESYESQSGIIFKVGDTITLGQPLSHLGWRSIYTTEGEDYITNKNLINKKVVIKSIDTTKEKPNLIVDYKKKPFNIIIDEALKNKEVMLDFKRELANEINNKYDALKKLKELLDSGILTQEEYETEKKKVLNN